MYIHFRKIYNLVVQVLETGRKLAFGEYVLFRSECKWISYFPTMYVYGIYSAMSKTPKQLPYCLTWAETSIVLFVFFMVSALLLLRFLTVDLCESGTRTAIFWSVTVYHITLSSQCNLTAQIEPTQDKVIYLYILWSTTLW